MLRSACSTSLGVDGGAADLEHVVGSAVVEHEAVVVEVAEIAGGVEAVGGEQLFAAAPADAAQRVRSADLDHADRARRHGCAGVGVDDADLGARRTACRSCPMPIAACRCRRDSRSTARTPRSSRTTWPAHPARPAGRVAAAPPGCPAAARTGRRRPSPTGVPRASAWSGQPRNSVTRSRSSSRSVVSGCGISSVISVAPASSADRMPLPKPPTQKNGIGRYSRVSASMHRAARPDRTAPSALPCEWMTPFGGPLLPEVNMMTRVSAGRDGCGERVDGLGRRRGRLRQLVGRPNMPQRRKFRRRAQFGLAGRRGSGARGTPRRPPGTARRRPAAARPVPVAASRVLSGTSTAPMRVRATAICTHATPLGMISPTRVPLLDAGLDERGGHRVRRRIEFAVADPGHRVDDHRLGRVLAARSRTS